MGGGGGRGKEGREVVEVEREGKREVVRAIWRACG